MLNRWSLLSAVFLVACGSEDNKGTTPPATDSGVVVTDGATDTGVPVNDVAVDAPPMPMGLPLTKTKVGSPKFEIVEVVQTTGKIGTSSDNFTAGRALVTKVLPKHSLAMGTNNIVSKTPHAPPYTNELSSGLTAASMTLATTFPIADWTQPQGLAMFAMIVPSADAPTGKSFDFASGPILLPNPATLSIDGDLLTEDGTVIDPDFDSAYPVADVDTGYSHIALVFFESTEFVPATTKGKLKWSLKLRDTDGAGWDVTAGPFTVE